MKRQTKLSPSMQRDLIGMWLLQKPPRGQGWRFDDLASAIKYELSRSTLDKRLAEMMGEGRVESRESTEPTFYYYFRLTVPERMAA